MPPLIPFALSIATEIKLTSLPYNLVMGWLCALFDMRICRSYLFFLLASVMPLCVAYFAQYALHIQPCLLCLYQRVPFFITIILAFIGTCITCSKSSWAQKLLFGLCCLAFLVNAGIAALHSGIEYHIIHNFIPCSSKTSIFELTPDSIEDIRDRLIGEDSILAIVNCEEPAVRLLGLSFSGWNFVYCVACMLLALVIRRYHDLPSQSKDIPK